MSKHNILFAFGLAFILGAISGGLGVPSYWVIIVAASLFSIFVFWKVLPIRKIFIALILSAFVFGSIYYSFDNWRYEKEKESFRGSNSISGIVVNDPRREEGRQVVKIKVDNHRVLAYLKSYPEINYGDVVSITGQIDVPSGDSYGRYLAKERIHATVFYPSFEVLGNKGNLFWQALYGLKNNTQVILDKLFSFSNSAFLSGLLLGERDDFSKEFLTKLSNSGTIHLVALSGQHMVIIIFIAAALLPLIFGHRRRLIFWLTFLITFLFVAMTGFAASAIRAALMAFLSTLAGEVNRNYNQRNALVFSALFLTLFNPKVPVFDLGFQLSFAATAAIIYFSPVLKRLKFFQKLGVLGWREVLLITLAAQVGVWPISVMVFNNFSVTGLFANIAILIIIPFLMVLGFLAVLAGSVFIPLALILVKPTAFLINYSVLVINFFDRFRFSFNPEIGIVAAIIYYIILIWLCFKYGVEKSNAHDKSIQ